MTTVIEIDALDSLDLCSTCENGFIKHFGLLKKVDEKCINTNKSTLHCSFCLNLLSSETIDHAVAIVRTLLSSSNLKSNDVVLESSYPRCLNIFRTLVYTRLHQHYKSSSDNSIPKIDKSLSLDHIFDSLFRQQWKESSSSSSAINVNKSIVRVGLSVTIDNQQLVLSTLASTLFPDIKLYERSKRKFNDVVVPIPTIEADHVDVNTEPMTVVNENDISNLVYEATLSSIKKKSAAEVEQLANQLVSLLSQIPQGNTVAGITQLNVSFSQAKFYLLGRYCKLSRDVPQSAWTMGGERKGRASVEEIICAQVKYGLRARLGNCGDCAMHACGREDIDVRCLGNGRPFALELTLAAHSIIDQSVLDEIRMQINDGVDSELNKEKDIQIPLLIKADSTVWTTMQAVAEEKFKGYRCVIRSQEPLTELRLQAQLEALTHTCRDPCLCDQSDCGLQILQRTPLRVLHRRSLLTRPRSVHCLRATLFPNDPHLFVLDLITSAGTYVKEFVHGDLGRTIPNVSALLGCKAQILQLDVVWLFDQYPSSLVHPTEPLSAETILQEVNFKAAVASYHDSEET